MKNGVKLGVRDNLMHKEVYLSNLDRFHHMYITGFDEAGREKMLLNQVIQDINLGNGFCFVADSGDILDKILTVIPKERAKDVIYFDIANVERPMGLNLYEIDNLDQADRTVNDATEIFLKMFGPEIFGPRIQEYFKYGSLTLLEDFEDRPTLLDVTRLFTDDGYREFKLKKVTNAVVKNRWEKTYNSMGDREKQEIIPYFSSKFVSFNTNRLIRNIIGQTKSAFKFDDIIRNHGILLINLSKDKVGELNCMLLVKILMAKLDRCLEKMTMQKEIEQQPFFLYLNNFQNYISYEFDNFLALATKSKLGVILSNIHCNQLNRNNFGGTENLTEMVFNSVKTICTFNVGMSDADILSKELYPSFSKKILINLKKFQGVVKKCENGMSLSPFNFVLRDEYYYHNNDIAPILKEYSAKKYGRRVEFIEEECRVKLGLSIDSKSLSETQGVAISGAIKPKNNKIMKREKINN